MAARKVSLRKLAESVGVHHQELNEIFRRLHFEVMDSGEETVVISQRLGTFYKRRRSGRRYVLLGEEYQTEDTEVLGLRPTQSRMAGDQVDRQNFELTTDAVDVELPSFLFDGEIRHDLRETIDPDQFEIYRVVLLAGAQLREVGEIGGVPFTDSFVPGAGVQSVNQSGRDEDVEFNGTQSILRVAFRAVSVDNDDLHGVFNVRLKVFYRTSASFTG